MINDNLRAAGVMVLAMLAFAIEDALIKVLAASMPVGQIIGVLGLGGFIVFAGICRAQGVALCGRAFLHPAVLLRNLAELSGAVGFVTALALIPLSTASAILQAAPLLVTLGAALFLAEPVGWRRWGAIIVGFGGVLMIIRPGTEGFNWLSIYAVVGVLGLAARDLATRRVPAAISSMQLSMLAFASLVPAAAILIVVSGDRVVAPSPRDWGILTICVLIGAVAYFAITFATRIGQISYVTPFRYSRMIFALIIALVFFGENPDALTLTGAAIIIASGLYTLWRERVVKSTASP
ncbi:DMT family transporter [uncultured Tateyamaria sp.]|uniref:DMT family transporter n=1 Tax=uncultured Tateyamaria sp. TaxID=455651 RepID=UPI0026357AE1|nr:DMT family transporter [uncultured Tateyamaria sp.]